MNTGSYYTKMVALLGLISWPSGTHGSQGRKQGHLTACMLKAMRGLPSITLDIHSMIFLPKIWGLANKDLSMGK